MANIFPSFFSSMVFANMFVSTANQDEHVREHVRELVRQQCSTVRAIFIKIQLLEVYNLNISYIMSN